MATEPSDEQLMGSLAAGEAQLSLSYKLTARMPLSAVAAPTRLYPYYEPDSMASDSPTRFTVK